MNLLNKYSHILILCLIIVSAFVLFSFNIRNSNLNRDELFTINIISLNDLSEIITKGNIEDTHPPLYHIILFIFVKIFGISEISIKILSTIFGCFSVIGLYVLAKKIYSIKEGLISGLIMCSISYIAITNQTARSYSLLLLLTIYTMIFLIDIIAQRTQNNILSRSIILYIFTSAMAIYTHYYAILLIVTELLFLLFFLNKIILKKILFVIIMIFLLYLPWIQYIRIKNVGTVKPVFLSWLEWDIFDGLNTNYSNYLLVIFCLTAILFIIYKIINKKNLLPYIYELMLLWIAFIPFIIVFILYFFGFKCYKSQYLIISVIPYYIFISRGIVLIFRKFILISTITMLTFLLTSFNMLKTMTNISLNQPNPKSVFLFVKNNFNKFDNSVLLIGFRDKSFEYYINKFNNNVIPDDRIKIVSPIQNIEYIVKNYNCSHIWLIDDISEDEFKVINLKYSFNKDISLFDGREWSASLFSIN